MGSNSLFSSKENNGLNVAVSGSEAWQMPEQASLLVERFKELDGDLIDFENDWKLVTLFIGGNDLCDFCNNRDLHEPKMYVKYITDALDILYKGLRRTFVNLVLVLNVSDVKYLNEGLVCTFIHRLVCPCAAFPESTEQENQLNAYLFQYHAMIEEIINGGRYEGRDDFTVVIQPFLKDFRLPKLPNGEIDFSFFAPDCFHLSTKGHGLFLKK
jgi:phospholipase B1, membrane-associated